MSKMLIVVDVNGGPQLSDGESQLPLSGGWTQIGVAGEIGLYLLSGTDDELAAVGALPSVHVALPVSEPGDAVEATPLPAERLPPVGKIGPAPIDVEPLPVDIEPVVSGERWPELDTPISIEAAGMVGDLLSALQVSVDLPEGATYREALLSAFGAFGTPIDLSQYSVQAV